ncbi:MAG: YdcF family protein [Candidatus Pacebacteria bacterium]|nr:YdcF family protein [Candidatus Paceibacterota bacterium]
MIKEKQKKRIKTAKGAIIVLGGMIKKRGKKWFTCGFNEGDKFGVTGDRLRVLAGAFIFKKLENKKTDFNIIASGGKVEKEISVAEVIKEELIVLGVPEKKIKEEKKSCSTFQQFLNIQSAVKKNKYEELIFITNEWHKPRVKIILKKAPKLENLRKMKREGKIKILGAERIVLKDNKKQWDKKIKRAYASLAMKKRIKLEKKGIRDIRNKRYIFK